jgi:hypothetical protein
MSTLDVAMDCRNLLAFVSAAVTATVPGTLRSSQPKAGKAGSGHGACKKGSSRPLKIEEATNPVKTPCGVAVPHRHTPASISCSAKLYSRTSKV